MAGTRSGGFKAAQTNYKKHGRDFYRNIGRKGGQNGTTGGFAAHPNQAAKCGAKGGAKSHRFPSLSLECALGIDHQVALSNVILIAYGMKLLGNNRKEMSPKIMADINKMCASNRWYHTFLCKYIDTLDLKAVFTYLMSSTKDEYTRDIYGSLRKSFKDVSDMNYVTTSKYEIELAKDAEKLLIASL